MPNSKCVVHFLMVDFGGGCSCCCCCDRGKTKSTPSPKTEVWTLDWSLTIISYFSIQGDGLVGSGLERKIPVISFNPSQRGCVKDVLGLFY